MNVEKRYSINIRKSVSGFFTINGRKIRTPAKFVAKESELPFIEARMRLEAIDDYEITEIEPDGRNATIKAK